MNPKFETAKRGGYDMEQVDMYINYIREEYNKIAAEYKELYARAEVLENEKNDVAGAMTAAHTYERNRKKAADGRAEKIIAQAQAKAEKIIADARIAAQRVQKKAQAQNMPPPAKPETEQAHGDFDADMTRIDVEMRQIMEKLSQYKAGGEVEYGTSDSKLEDTENGNQDAASTRRGVSDANRYAANITPIRAAGG